MNINIYFGLSLLISSAMYASESKPLVASESLFAISKDNKPLKLDPVWREESQWIQRTLVEKPTAGGTEKTVLTLPIDFESFNEINSFLMPLKNKKHDQLRQAVMTLVTGGERNLRVLIAKIQKLNKLFAAIKSMSIGQLESFFKEAYIFVLKRETILNSFALSPQFLEELMLPEEVATSPIQVLSPDDQAFLRAQLSTVLQSNIEASSIEMSPTTQYAVTCGTDEDKSYFEVWDIMKDKPLRQVLVDHPLHAAQFYSNEQIITWSEKGVDLWAQLGTAKITPSWWKEMLKGTKKIWGLEISSDQKLLAIGADEKIFLINMVQGNYKTLTPPTEQKTDKQNKQKTSSSLLFTDSDKVIVWLRPSGELFFYKSDMDGKGGDKVICFAHEKGVGTEFSSFYSVGSNLMTISSSNHSCIWDCRLTSKKRSLQNGSIPSSNRVFVPRGRHAEISPTKRTCFCDTTSDEFSQKFPLILTEGDMSNDITVGSDGYPQVISRSGKCLSLPSLQTLISGYLSTDGSAFCGIDKEYTARIWHYYNKEAADFLASRMTLRQGLFLQLVVQHIREEQKNKEFAKQPHMRAIFSGFAQKIRSLLCHSFPALAALETGSVLFSRGASSNSSDFQKASSSTSSTIELTRSTSLSSGLGGQSAGKNSSASLENITSASSTPWEGTDAPRKTASTPGREDSQATSSTTGEAEGLYSAGAELFKQGVYKAAYETLSQVYTQKESKQYQALAANLLGEMNLRGYGIDVNPAAALPYFEKAARSVPDKALQAVIFEKLGELYLFGLGVKKAQIKAFDYFARIKDNPDATAASKIPALFFLHRALYRAANREFKRNDAHQVNDMYNLVMTLCEKTILEGRGEDQALAWLYKGRLLMYRAANNKEYGEVGTCFIHAAELTESYLKAEAFYRLGKLHINKLNAFTEAEAFFEKASAYKCKSWVQAMANLYLGDYRKEGKGSKEKSASREALEYYERLLQLPYAAPSQAEAAYRCARLYEKGDRDLELSPAKVFYYDSQAATIGDTTGEIHTKAHYSLAMQYYTGTPTVPIQLPLAFNHFKVVMESSEDQNHLDEACFRLAEMSRKGGSGVKRDSTFAKECYQRLHEHGKNLVYAHRAYYFSGRYSFLQKDLIKAEVLLNIATKLTHDPEIQKDAKILYAKLEKAVEGIEENSDDEEDKKEE